MRARPKFLGYRGINDDIQESRILTAFSSNRIHSFSVDAKESIQSYKS